jgi:hypothetical protein
MGNTLLQLFSFFTHPTKQGAEMSGEGRWNPKEDQMKDANDIQRYAELVRIAPSESIAVVHEEAFARLSLPQREEMFEALTANASTEADRPADPSPTALAQAAARQEQEHPGSLARLFASRSDETDPTSGLFATFVTFAIGSQLSLSLLASTPPPGAGADGDEDGQPGFPDPGFDGFDAGF